MKVCVFVLSLILAVADAGSLRGFSGVGSNDAEGSVPEMKIERSDRLVVASKRVSTKKQAAGTRQMITFIQKHQTLTHSSIHLDAKGREVE